MYFPSKLLCMEKEKNHHGRMAGKNIKNYNLNRTFNYYLTVSTTKFTDVYFFRRDGSIGTKPDKINWPLNMFY